MKLLSYQKFDDGTYILKVEHLNWFLRKKVFLYRGFSTVWHNHITGKRAGTFVEEKLCDITYSLQWEEKHDWIRKYHGEARKTETI